MFDEFAEILIDKSKTKFTNLLAVMVSFCYSSKPDLAILDGSGILR